MIVVVLLVVSLIGSLALIVQMRVRSRRGAGSVRAQLNELKSEGYLVLHGVTFGGRGDADHVVIGPDKVVVVASPLAVATQATLLQDELGCPVTPVAADREVAAAIRAAPGGTPVDLQRIYALVG